MGAPPGPCGKDVTWPDQVVPRGRKASSTRNQKRQNLKVPYSVVHHNAYESNRYEWNVGQFVGMIHSAKSLLLAQAVVLL